MEFIYEIYYFYQKGEKTYILHSRFPSHIKPYADRQTQMMQSIGDKIVLRYTEIPINEMPTCRSVCFLRNDNKHDKCVTALNWSYSGFKCGAKIQSCAR